jgi:formiminotetrahydrofolate cyclodeaminase
MLREKTVSDYTALMSTDYGALGGGGASALSGALGAALTAMVATLTIGRKKYAEEQTLAVQTAARANELKDAFLDVMERDTAAFEAVSDIFAMPKDTEAEKMLRKTAMQTALKKCTQTPLQMMKLASETLTLTEKLIGHSNKSAASDLGCAALQLKAALQGAWLNVCINLGGIEDESFSDECRARGQALLDPAVSKADRIYSAICDSL